MCLVEEAKGNRVRTGSARRANCSAGLSAVSPRRMQSGNASPRLCWRRLPTVHAGRLVFQAGSLLGVKEEGMVERQTQDRASA
jgi:hypothetical protein